MKIIEPIAKNHFETLAWKNSHFVCGIDEVGRGCLAGPVVVSAVILPLNCDYSLLQDSKIMTARKREEAFQWIKKHCWYSLALASHTHIDTHNIYQTTLMMMKKALLQLLAVMPISLTALRSVVIDAMPLSLESMLGENSPSFYHMNYGETYSSSIAAASIVAKVTRDALLTTMSESFPLYHLNQHKGYATSQHIKSVQEHGASIIHRATFLTHFNRSTTHEVKQQQSLF